MFNLYADAIDQDGFMGLVSKNTNEISESDIEKSNSIIASFAIASLLLVSVMVNGAQSQKLVELEQLASIGSYSSIV
ncbi:hypothetical protein [Pseudemcibacter aquimaris]|uniref:hypothetical protein n=1 Tax=Pseudemcibacter aquimaris TaxID=2857064 RepID=UPI00201334F2|nr:hypothetical protein [Pseudemcibacter aquimaris]MCC3862141.1 hypothetical protein [Pseudemcibacter aquimaris]WDU58894.1 hypothetical protein KW060_01225 [Pseudemcibacter aquimaris]